MGVRGLTWLAHRHSQFREEQLSSCPLVVDGSNFYSVLLVRLGYITGGVYETFVQLLKNFFNDLKR